jgi:hypothetical protein
MILQDGLAFNLDLGKGADNGPVSPKPVSLDVAKCAEGSGPGPVEIALGHHDKGGQAKMLCEGRESLRVV